MSNQLIPTAPVLPERFANPLRQLSALLRQPIVRRSLPMTLLVSLLGAAALAWMTLASPEQKTLFTGLPDADKAAVTAALQQANITSKIDEGTGALTVGEDDYSRARILLAGQGLPKAAPGGYQILDSLPMGVSRAVEGERLRQARETELARSIQEIDAVAEARVHLATPEASVFVRDNAAPSASVIVKLHPGRTLGEAQVGSIINLVASSVPGMKPEGVTIVDQMGSMLTHPKDQDSTTMAGDARIDFQRRIEDKYRAQLTQLLTPLVGVGNFSAEIQADVNLDETQATRESYDKQGTLRAEQGNWSGAKDGAAAPGGIPGALSNAPPAASSISTPPKPGAALPAPTATPAPGGVATAGDAAKQSETYARAYDLGKEVSVTRAMPGAIKRLSVAVLLRDTEKGKPRSPAEIQQITQLVRAAVGYDAARNDQVTVIARKFAGGGTIEDKAPWYDAGWLPIVARNLTALVIAVLVLMLGVRPLAKALLKKREDTPVSSLPPGAALASPAAPGEPGAPVTLHDANGQPVPVSIEMLDQARGYDERISMVRGFTRDNPTRAALAVRDMIRADAN